MTANTSSPSKPGRRSGCLLTAGVLLMLVSLALLAVTLATGPGPGLIASLTAAAPTASASPAPTATPLPDTDQDGVPDPADPCPALAHPAHSDLDADNWGDACDLDLDGDNLSNHNDPCPFDDGEACLGPAPVTVNLLNPAVLADQVTAGVGYVGLTTFENADPTRPALLNGAIYPASEAPLWSGSGDLALNLSFTVGAELPAFAAAGGQLALAGGRISLNCPAGGIDGIGGLCAGRLNLDLMADGAPASAPPGCLPGDARCAWSVNAAFASPDMMNVWGAYNSDDNTVRFATGLPASPGNAFDTTYSVDMRLSDGSQATYQGTLPGVELPYALADGVNDCRDVEDEPADCLPSSDIQTVTVNPEIIDGAPFLVIRITTGGEIPQSRQAEYTVFDVFAGVEQDGQFALHLFDAFPGDGGWTVRGRVRRGEAEPEPMEALPAGTRLTAEGNVAEFRLPILVGAQQTFRLSYIRARSHSGQAALHVDGFRDAGFDASPLAFLVHASEESEGALPLIGFPQFESDEEQYHVFMIVPFPGSPLAEALAPAPEN